MSDACLNRLTICSSDSVTPENILATAMGDHRQIGVFEDPGGHGPAVNRGQ